MKPSRKLALAKETLTELTPEDLGAVVGGTPPEPTPPIYAPTSRCTGVYPTLPIRDCVQVG
jgi:hypothetical protein